MTAVKPKAGFYIFPKLDTKRFNITNDEQFAFDLLHQKKILLSHLIGTRPIVSVWCSYRASLSDAVNKLEDFLSTYRKIDCEIKR